jgi:hypothetical protein
MGKITYTRRKLRKGGGIFGTLYKKATQCFGPKCPPNNSSAANSAAQSIPPPMNPRNVERARLNSLPQTANTASQHAALNTENYQNRLAQERNKQHARMETMQSQRAAAIKNRNELNELLGYGPIHSAGEGVMDRIYVLIDSVDLTKPDKNGDTPLHIAMYIGNYEAANYIIEKNRATLNIVNPKDGYTPLLYCIRNYGRHYKKYGMYYRPQGLVSPDIIINKILNVPDFNINQTIQNGEKQITALSLANQMKDEYARSVEPLEKAMAVPYTRLIPLLQKRGARQGGKLRKRASKQYHRTRRQRN